MTRGALRRGTALLMAVGLVFGAASVAGASGHTETLYAWTDLTEGVAVDNDGNIFVSSSPVGELWKIAPGASPEVFGTIDGIDAAAGDIGLLGLAADRDGNIYGAVFSPNGPDAHGVWKFDAATGDATRLAGSDAIVFPNSVAFDARGVMYVTDTAIGAVWRLGKSGTFEPWVIDPLMQGDGSLGTGNPIGANGIAVVDRTVYVSVTEGASILSVPINRDGSAGPVGFLAADPALFAVDGIAAAADGSIFAGIIGQFAVVHVLPDGTVLPVASAANGDAGVLDVSSVAFGTTPDTRSTLYGVNFGVLSQEGFGSEPRPGLVAIQTPVVGQPIP